jgi:hypothetical protein
MARIGYKVKYNLKIDQHEYFIIQQCVQTAMDEMKRMNVTVPESMRKLYLEMQESKI